MPVRQLRDRGRKLARRLWSARTSFALRCDLSRLGEPPPAHLDVEMRPVDPQGFRGFTEEVGHVPRREVSELLSRDRMCRRGVPGLYVAYSPAGRPAFAQWLVRPGHDDLPVRILGEGLGPDEVLVEGAYTFAEFRGQGAMRAGMYQLLVVARDEGYRWARTGVAVDNVASLRGCHRVGFELDYVRQAVSRLGVTRRRYRPPRPGDEERWRQAIR